MARAEPKPIDALQHVWWHRLRRLGCWGFTLGGGALLAPLATCVLFAGVIVYFQYPWSAYFRNSAILWLVSAPIYIGACLWTWFHMEGRYRATLALHCPACGYDLAVVSADGRCPECGTPTAGPDQAPPDA